MHFINYHVTKIICDDFLLKYQTKNTKILPRLEKVILSAKLSVNYKTSISVLIGILTFLKPCLTYSRKNLLTINLRKGEPVGIKITLRQKQMENFITLFLFEILPSLKKFKNLSFKNGSLQWQIKDIFDYEDLLDIYIYISEVPLLDITISGKNLNHNFFIGWRVPINKILDK